MRDPILCCRRSFLEEYFKETEIDLDDLFSKAKKHKVHLDFDEKTFMKYSKISEAEKVQEFNLILLKIRQEINPNSSIIKKQDSAYQLLTEITILANDFCTEYNLNSNEGFKIYITRGLALIGKDYSLNKFKYYNQKIIKQYNDENLLLNTPYKTELKSCVRKYNELSNTNKINDQDRVNLVYMIEQSLAENSDPLVWMRIQFEYFESMNLIPEPNQLHGNNALIRYNKNKPSERDLMLSKLKNRKNA